VIYSLRTGAGNSLFYDFSQDTTRQGKPDDVSPVTDGWPELMIGTTPKKLFFHTPWILRFSARNTSSGCN